MIQEKNSDISLLAESFSKAYRGDISVEINIKFQFSSAGSIY
jgi:hypothetical protein